METESGTGGGKRPLPTPHPNPPLTPLYPQSQPQPSLETRIQYSMQPENSASARGHDPPAPVDQESRCDCDSCCSPVRCVTDAVVEVSRWVKEWGKWGLEGCLEAVGECFRCG
ncbi:hypothetical protein K491DRAFT_698358 [Lophiostoma macrostomum CBS 122681]|uniref:Uncharacterized protein n=1 Tax=Lophiostoma macrostomum CBS 122681 TaxID=1314788 RepID=A0A6A6SNS8_9PLEO|nr:hypothetical protein K491DRAFT_698358 [Lophiostoma macrostomum CBS 122681]